MPKRLAYQAHTQARLSGAVHASVHAGPIPTVRLGNLTLRFHDAEATADLARLVLLLKKHTICLRYRTLSEDVTDQMTTTMTLVELRGPQPLAGLRVITPAASHSGCGEVSVLFGNAVRLIITDQSAAERTMDAFERALHDATIEYPDARPLADVAEEIKKRWAWRLSTRGAHA